MRHYEFGRASSVAMGKDTRKYAEKRGCGNGFSWLFSGESIGIVGAPSTKNMRDIPLPDDYPYPSASIGCKKELYEALLRGQCYPSCCVSSTYEAVMKVGPKKWKRLLDDYFEKLPEGTYVILSTDWD